MKNVKHVGVIDIGKTNAKVAVVDIESEQEIGVLTRPNDVLPGPPYPHFDIEGHWNFICLALKQLHEAHGIDALSVTAHGASGVLLDKDGNLAAPVIDYEFTGPDDLAPEYNAIRPSFEETGSPHLGMGLNVGAQLFWQFKSDPELSDRTATFLTYPQYWTYRLTGIQANEVSSLGCHTDLWCPHENHFSSLVECLGLAGKMAPVKRAVDCMGSILPEIAAKTGLPKDTLVSCGIHDSNASLYPHLLKRQAPFSVVSTGTWVIVLSVGGAKVVLDPTRDTLVNVNALGDLVPSARFMGGREFEMVMDGCRKSCTGADVARVLEKNFMLLPAVDPRSGPFQGRQCQWNTDEYSLSDGERFVAISFYLALMTAECLEMTGAMGPVIVEGPFARNMQYLAMLHAATGRAVKTSDGSSTGTSIGAALLCAASNKQTETKQRQHIEAIDTTARHSRYARKWRELLG
ncbi:L-fuculokinase [Roseibium album]|nr:L-fuculokinase [Roseibium album]